MRGEMTYKCGGSGSLKESRIAKRILLRSSVTYESNS